ncbi:NAD(P)-binding domain-containing protein [Streptomyces sp. NPDC005969]
MGTPIARNLLGARLQVRAWNRTRHKAEALATRARTSSTRPPTRPPAWTC